MSRSPRAIGLALLVGVASVVTFASAAMAGGGERFVLAWPPTRYRSAELILWLDDANAPASVHVVGRGLDSVVDLSGPDAVRIPLPLTAQCGPGVDACAIRAERVAGTGRFVAALQSPDTAGAADTLLRTAHDTVLLAPLDGAAVSHVLLSLPNPAASPFPESASFASIVPTTWPARVSVSAAPGRPLPCVTATDVALAQGEVLSLTCSAAGEDLTGALAESDVPCVVLSGNVVTCVPWDGGSGLSGDLALDLSPALRSGPTTLVVPPLPRLGALAGRGDVVRIVALETTTLSVIDADGSTPMSLVAGQVLDLDTAGAGGDRALRINSAGAIAAWHVPKSRALRGLGDPAAIPLVPREAFTRRARFFVPDGYSEANALVVVAERGANVRLDGVAMAALAAAPHDGSSADLEYGVVELAPPTAGTGSVHELLGDEPFAAWIVGLGGYKAHGMAAALEWPAPSGDPPMGILRGLAPDALALVATGSGRAWTDVDAGLDRLVFYSLSEDLTSLRVSTCGGAACLSW